GLDGCTVLGASTKLGQRRQRSEGAHDAIVLVADARSPAAIAQLVIRQPLEGGRKAGGTALLEHGHAGDPGCAVGATGDPGPSVWDETPFHGSGGLGQERVVIVARVEVADEVSDVVDRGFRAASVRY